MSVDGTPSATPPVNPSDLAWALQGVLLDNVERAAQASHRPFNVRNLFVDANARMVFAEAIEAYLCDAGYVQALAITTFLAGS